jgi:hypothetical protein
MKRVTLLVVLAALVLAGGASAKTWKLHGLGVAILLPHNWLQKSATTGWRFEAARPTTGTGVFINAFPAAQDPGGTFHHDLIAFETQVARGADRHATIATRGTTVAGEGAIEIIARYRGLTAYLYGFRHGNVDFTLEFVTKTAQLAQSKPEFAAALKSLRFIG